MQLKCHNADILLTFEVIFKLNAYDPFSQILFFCVQFMQQILCVPKYPINYPKTTFWVAQVMILSKY